MKYFKFTEEENEKALEKCGITADDAAKAWQDDPADEDKFIRFMSIVFACDDRKASGTYVLKPEVMKEVNNLVSFFENNGTDIREDWRDFSITPNYKNQTINVQFKTHYICLWFDKDNKAMLSAIIDLLKSMEVSLSNDDSIIFDFTIADAFIHIPDEKKE